MPLPDSLRRVLDRKNATPSAGYSDYVMRDGTCIREYDNGTTKTLPSVDPLPPSICPNCGAWMVGDGTKTIIHCQNAKTETDWQIWRFAKHVFCEEENPFPP